MQSHFFVKHFCSKLQRTLHSLVLIGTTSRYEKGDCSDPMSKRNNQHLMKYSVCFLLLFVGLTALPIHGENTASPTAKDEVEVGSVLASEHEANAMNFAEFISKLVAQNERIQSGRLQWGIASTAVTNAESEFQTTFSASYKREGSKTRNTVEEALARSSLAEYEKLDDTYDVVFSKKTGTGATVQFSSTLAELRNSLQPSSFESERKSFVGVSVSQPLLKNGWWGSNLARIRMSERDRGIAYQRYRQEVMQILNRGSSYYWDLYLNQEIKNIVEESLVITEKLFKDLELRESIGRASRTDVLDAGSGVSLRKALLVQSSRSLQLAESRLASLLVERRLNLVGGKTATEEFSVNPTKFDRARMIRTTLAVNPNYLASLEQAEKEDIRIVYATNQRYPELNLLATYGLNGLGDSNNSSIKDLEMKDHPTWVVGLQLKVAVGRDKKTTSELAAAIMHKQEALLNVKAAEVAAINTIDSAINEVESLYDEYLQVEAVRISNQQLFEIELDRQRTGSSSVRLVLEREMELNLATKGALEVSVAHQMALISLRILDGTLLAELGLNENEPDYGDFDSVVEK